MRVVARIRTETLLPAFLLRSRTAGRERTGLNLITSTATTALRTSIVVKPPQKLKMRRRLMGQGATALNAQMDFVVTFALADAGRAGAATAHAGMSVVASTVATIGSR